MSPTAYKQRVVAATGADTVLTDAFDLATGMPWPDGVSGRALRNRFFERWEHRDDELRAWSADQRDEYRSLGPGGRDRREGGLGGRRRVVRHEIASAGDVVRDLVAEADSVLRSRPTAVLRAEG